MSVLAEDKKIMQKVEDEKKSKKNGQYIPLKPDILYSVGMLK